MKLFGVDKLRGLYWCVYLVYSLADRKIKCKAYMVAHSCNPSTPEVESLRSDCTV